MVLAPLPPPRARRPTPVPVPAPIAGVDDLERLLQELIGELTPGGWARPATRGRPPSIPAAILWSALVVCVLRGWTTQADLWRLLAQVGLWEYPRLLVSDQAIYHRLDRDGPGPLQELFVAVSAALRPRLEPYAEHDLAPFARGVYAIDTTTLDPVARRLAELRDLPATQRLPGKLGEVFDVRRQQWERIIHRPDAVENDKLHARDLVVGLPIWSLLLFDLGYFAFGWFDDLTDARYYYISRLRAKTSFTRIHVFYDDGQTFDGIVWLGAHRADRAKHAVRLVEFHIGTQVHRYITNVRDPELLPIAMIAQLYARRWDVEMAAQLVKEHLGLRVVWSSKPQVVLDQVWAVLLVAQVLQGLRLEIAGRAEVDLFEVSLPLLVKYLPRLAAAGQDPLEVFITEGRRLGFIRPSRRTVIRAPCVAPEALVRRPVGLVLRRTPRYAGKA